MSEPARLGRALAAVAAESLTPYDLLEWPALLELELATARLEIGADVAVRLQLHAAIAAALVRRAAALDALEGGDRHQRMLLFIP